MILPQSFASTRFPSSLKWLPLETCYLPLSLLDYFDIQFITAHQWRTEILTDEHFKWSSDFSGSWSPFHVIFHRRRKGKTEFDRYLAPRNFPNQFCSCSNSPYASWAPPCFDVDLDGEEFYTLYNSFQTFLLVFWNKAHLSTPLGTWARYGHHFRSYFLAWSFIFGYICTYTPASRTVADSCSHALLRSPLIFNE